MCGFMFSTSIMPPKSKLQLLLYKIYIPFILVNYLEFFHKILKTEWAPYLPFSSVNYVQYTFLVNAIYNVNDILIVFTDIFHFELIGSFVRCPFTSSDIIIQLLFDSCDHLPEIFNIPDVLCVLFVLYYELVKNVVRFLCPLKQSCNFFLFSVL